jgi:nitroreductase
MLKNEIIGKRKSIRKYKTEKLRQETLLKVQEKLQELKPLYPDIEYSAEVVEQVKRTFGIKAPHYLLFYSEEKEGAYENIGFLGQQMDLFFSENGLGACWLGVAKEDKKSQEESSGTTSDGLISKKGEVEKQEEKGKNKLVYIICIAFGLPDEPLYRSLEEFKRKPLSQMSHGDDKRLEGARLAPSGVNAQNWFFIGESGKVHCYRKNPGGVIGLFKIYSKLSLIDIGIAICHLAEESEGFTFTQDKDHPIREGWIYVGTVS